VRRLIILSLEKTRCGAMPGKALFCCRSATLSVEVVMILKCAAIRRDPASIHAQRKITVSQ
jgi:hypothetical protein